MASQSQAKTEDGHTDQLRSVFQNGKVADIQPCSEGLHHILFKFGLLMISFFSGGLIVFHCPAVTPSRVQDSTILLI